MVRRIENEAQCSNNLPCLNKNKITDQLLAKKYVKMRKNAC
nr:MAG: hypothetical protein [Apis mellifera filamentous virus]